MEGGRGGDCSRAENRQGPVLGGAEAPPPSGVVQRPVGLLRVQGVAVLRELQGRARALPTLGEWEGRSFSSCRWTRTLLQGVTVLVAIDRQENQSQVTAWLKGDVPPRHMHVQSLVA